MRTRPTLTLAGCLLLAACGSKETPPDPNAGLIRSANPGAPINKEAYADPNPLPCTPASADPACLFDTSLPGRKGCCQIDFPQNPSGKCGVEYGSSGCVERIAPGNMDSTCSDDGGPVKWTNAFLSASGPPCCAWRTKACGGWDDTGTYGCVVVPNRGPDAGTQGNVGVPCSPRYDQGIVTQSP